MSILYISYEGMMEPLGQSQVLSYLERSSESPIHLISFEKPGDWKNTELRQRITARIERSGIVWHPLPYHRKPSALATAFDIFAGMAVGTYLVVRHKLAIVHARSYVPATMALAIKRLTGAKFVFDMRGFWADEPVDGAIWPRGGVLYRVAKAMERLFLLRSDAIISLTHAAAKEIAGFPYLAGGHAPISVIPTCADLERFAPGARQATPAAPFTLGYVGNVGHWYMFDEVIRCFAALTSILPESKLLVVNRGQHEFIREQIRLAGLPTEHVELITAEHGEMPRLVRRMTAAVMMARPAYSHLARAPTKLAEFLGCGVPCLANDGIGDVSEILESDRVGVVLRDASDKGRKAAIGSLVGLTRDAGTVDRCTTSARATFSLESGVIAYGAVYRELTRTK